MFKKYQNLVVQKIREMAIFSLKERAKIEPMNWKAAFISELKNYLDIDKGKSTAKPPLAGLVKPDCSNLMSVLADLKTQIADLWVAKELGSYCSSDVDIEALISHLTASHSPYHPSEVSLWFYTSASTSPLKATDNPLFYFTSMDRAVAYYTTMLLAESAKSFNDCKKGITEARTSRYFEPGLISNTLNIRTSQAAAKARGPIADYLHAYDAIYLRTKKSLCTEEEFNGVCKSIIADHIKATPRLKAYHHQYVISTALYNRNKTSFKFIIEMADYYENELELQDQEIAKLEAILSNEPGLLAQAMWDKGASYSEDSVEEIKAANSNAMLEQLIRMNNNRVLLLEQLNQYNASLAPLTQSLLDLKETMDEKEYTLCELYYSNADIDKLIKDLPTELEDKIITNLTGTLEARYQAFKHEIGELNRGLSATAGTYKASSPIASTSAVTAFSAVHSASGSGSSESTLEYPVASL